MSRQQALLAVEVDLGVLRTLNELGAFQGEKSFEFRGFHISNFDERGWSSLGYLQSPFQSSLIKLKKSTFCSLRRVQHLCAVFAE